MQYSDMQLIGQSMGSCGNPAVLFMWTLHVVPIMSKWTVTLGHYYGTDSLADWFRDAKLTGLWYPARTGVCTSWYVCLINQELRCLRGYDKRQMTEAWQLIWTTNVYSVYKHQTNRWDPGVWSVHTVLEHPERGEPHLCTLRTVRPLGPSVCCMWHKVHDLVRAVKFVVHRLWLHFSFVIWGHMNSSTNHWVPFRSHD